MAEIKLKIKPTAGGALFEVTSTLESTILELKEEVAKQCDGATAAQIKLIYKGTYKVGFSDHVNLERFSNSYSAPVYYICYCRSNP